MRLRRPQPHVTRVAWVDQTGYHTQDHDTPQQAHTHETHLRAKGIKQVQAYELTGYERAPE